MNTRKILDDEFLKQKIVSSSNEELLTRYLHVARGYVELENALAVLSDLNKNESYIIRYGFNPGHDSDSQLSVRNISSIWEDEVFRTIHPDDLDKKFLRELRFYHYIKTMPLTKCFRQCLMQKMRMMSSDGRWIDVLHKMFYIPSPDNRNIAFALCLYSAMPYDLKADAVIVDMSMGTTVVMDESVTPEILSKREIVVLQLIDKGNSSKNIAATLNISINTVSRHRQNILKKLNVRNSAEACRVARNLSIL